MCLEKNNLVYCPRCNEIMKKQENTFDGFVCEKCGLEGKIDYFGNIYTEPVLCPKCGTKINVK